MAGGQLFVISAPSGTGKSTVCRAVRERMPSLAYSVSYTTRPPRPGEVDGRDYHFVDRERFMQMVANGEMAEYAEVFGHLYGTSAAALARSLSAGTDILLDIDTAGAAQLMRRFPGAIYIFLLPPSMAELSRRLRSRATETPAQLAQRLGRAREEIKAASSYTHIVVNDRLEKAVEEICCIITAERLRTPRRMQLVQRLLDEEQ